MINKDDIRLHSGELACIEAGAIGIAAGPTKLHPHVTAIDPSQLLQPLLQGRHATLPLRVVLGEDGEHADPARLVRLLRPRRERPCGRRAAEQRDELAPPHHSITSSARASSVGGTSTPSALAVLRLIASSYLVGACTGRSAGFSPLRMRST